MNVLVMNQGKMVLVAISEEEAGSTEQRRPHEWAMISVTGCFSSSLDCLRACKCNEQRAI